jgi:hypothetical protein
MYQNLNSNLMVGWGIFEKLISNTSTTNQPQWIRSEKNYSKLLTFPSFIPQVLTFFLIRQLNPLYNMNRGYI